VIPGRRGREYLRSVDPGLPNSLPVSVRALYVVLLWISLVIVVGSLGIVQRAESRAEASELGFGYPLHYVVVDDSWIWGAGNSGGPFSTRFDPWEDWDVTLRFEYFLLDWAAVAVVLCGPVFLYRRRRLV
jgi:hypothetical protein